ncbi:hypothetical protein BDP27DRAFT_1368778 [Rhodocollybia butyracea]|uniref:Uncharacterized protein n=1 Tax=Rhodocollybia butyracea TaxID=206335 RepID=A0A9P5PI41_9AGAR|nr:hypothetical protein BDP27DRAFT_1368778 [Rhodocollybia butyracea]
MRYNVERGKPFAYGGHKQRAAEGCSLGEIRNENSTKWKVKHTGKSVHYHLANDHTIGFGGNYYIDELTTGFCIRELQICFTNIGCILVLSHLKKPAPQCVKQYTACRSQRQEEQSSLSGVFLLFFEVDRIVSSQSRKSTDPNAFGNVGSFCNSSDASFLNKGKRKKAELPPQDEGRDHV